MTSFPQNGQNSQQIKNRQPFTITRRIAGSMNRNRHKGNLEDTKVSAAEMTSYWFSSAGAVKMKRQMRCMRPIFWTSPASDTSRHRSATDPVPTFRHSPEDPDHIIQCRSPGLSWRMEGNTRFVRRVGGYIPSAPVVVMSECCCFFLFYIYLFFILVIVLLIKYWNFSLH